MIIPRIALTNIIILHDYPKECEYIYKNNTTMRLLHSIMAAMIAFCIGTNAEATPSWYINPDGAIQWDVKPDELPHHDHIEMAGDHVSMVLRWGIDQTGALSLDRSLIFPMLRTVPNVTQASLMHRFSVDIMDMVKINGATLANERVESVTIDGNFKAVSTFDAPIAVNAIIKMIEGGFRLERTLTPSVDKPLIIEHLVLTNLGKNTETVFVPEVTIANKTLPERGIDGAVYRIEESCKSITVNLKAGESMSWDVCYQAYRDGTEQPVEPDYEREMAARDAFVHQDIDQSLVLETPDSVINTMFRYAKIRAAESIFDTRGGLMHGPGGEAYYAAIWANDQAEYVNPFFPFLGYAKGNGSAFNSFRLFAGYMNDEFKAIPSSIIAEGTNVWKGAGDRGDAAMIAYGAARYALALGDKQKAQELWPLISWCLEYCRRKLTPDGVVASRCDELEGRFKAGKANLCTSSLYYDALLSASWLAPAIGRPVAEAKELRKRAEEMERNIESFFGADMCGYHTYRYYDGNTLLRSWICIPLVMGITTRAEGTADALFGPELWSNDGILTEQGSDTYWDRSTLYALRGVYCAGMADLATEKLQFYSHRRLLEDHVPYAIEAWPEGSQRHLSAESGLYCRVVTEGMFGIRPTGFRSFTMKPSIPSEWNGAALRHIKAFGSDFDIEITRIAGSSRLQVSVKGQPAAAEAQTGAFARTYTIKPGQEINVKLDK